MSNLQDLLTLRKSFKSALFSKKFDYYNGKVFEERPKPALLEFFRRYVFLLNFFIEAPNFYHEQSVSRPLRVRYDFRHYASYQKSEKKIKKNIRNHFDAFGLGKNVFRDLRKTSLIFWSCETNDSFLHNCEKCLQFFSAVCYFFQKSFLMIKN